MDDFIQCTPMSCKSVTHLYHAESDTICKLYLDLNLNCNSLIVHTCTKCVPNFSELKTNYILNSQFAIALKTWNHLFTMQSKPGLAVWEQIYDGNGSEKVPWDQFTNRPCKVTKIYSLVIYCLLDEAMNSEITDSLIFLMWWLASLWWSCQSTSMVRLI